MVHNEQIVHSILKGKFMIRFLLCSIFCLFINQNASATVYCWGPGVSSGYCGDSQLCNAGNGFYCQPYSIILNVDIEEFHKNYPELENQPELQLTEASDQKEIGYSPVPVKEVEDYEKYREEVSAEKK